MLIEVFALIGFVALGKHSSLIASAIFIGVLLKAGIDVLDRDFPKTFIQKKNGLRIQLVHYKQFF